MKYVSASCICIYIPLCLSPRTLHIYHYRPHTYIAHLSTLYLNYLSISSRQHIYIPSASYPRSMYELASLRCQYSNANNFWTCWSLTVRLVPHSIEDPPPRTSISSPYYLCQPCLSSLRAASPHKLWVRLFQVGYLNPRENAWLTVTPVTFCKDRWTKFSR